VIDTELRAINALLTEMARRRKAGDMSSQPLIEVETRLRRLKRRIHRYKYLNEQSAPAPSSRRNTGAGNAR